MINTTDFLLDYPYFKDKLTAIGLSKQEALDVDPKVKLKIIFLES